MKNTYVIDLMAQTRYIIKAETKDEAVDLAYKYWEDYIPNCSVKIDNEEEPEIEI